MSPEGVAAAVQMRDSGTSTNADRPGRSALVLHRSLERSPGTTESLTNSQTPSVTRITTAGDPNDSRPR
jgi:hypothetical protein